MTQNLTTVTVIAIADQSGLDRLIAIKGDAMNAASDIYSGRPEYESDACYWIALTCDAADFDSVIADDFGEIWVTAGSAAKALMDECPRFVDLSGQPVDGQSRADADAALREQSKLNVDAYRNSMPIAI
jgi:hypothetical protein